MQPLSIIGGLTTVVEGDQKPSWVGAFKDDDAPGEAGPYQGSLLCEVRLKQGSARSDAALVGQSWRHSSMVIHISLQIIVGLAEHIVVIVYKLYLGSIGRAV